MFALGFRLIEKRDDIDEIIWLCDDVTSNIVTNATRFTEIEAESMAKRIDPFGRTFQKIILKVDD